MANNKKLLMLIRTHKQFLSFIILSFCILQNVVAHVEIASLPDVDEILEPCHVPTGKVSFCVPLERCPPLNTLYRSLPSPRQKEITNYLNESFYCLHKNESFANEGTMCCPFESIINPTLHERPQIEESDFECSPMHQYGRPGSCILFFHCKPFVHLISNLTRPFLSDFSSIMKHSLLCGEKHVGGFNLPKVCCPPEAFIEPEGDSTAVSTTTENHSESITPNTKATISKKPETEPETSTVKSIDSTHTNYTFSATYNPNRTESIYTGTNSEVTTTKYKPLTDEERFASHPNRMLLTSTEECPLQEHFNRIVGGSEAPIGEYPWLAVLGYSGKNVYTGTITGRDKWQCGGSLIGDQYVLTAAHCVNMGFGCENCTFSLTKVRLGEHEIMNELISSVDCNDPCPWCELTCNAGNQDIEIEEVIIHPKYGGRRNLNQNDIALIRLKKKVQRNEFVKPICLPYEDDVNEDYVSGESTKHGAFWVAGWGATTMWGTNHADKLQHIQMPVFDGDKCQSVWGHTRAGQLNQTIQLCVGGQEGKDSCNGDSGSSLMTKRFNATAWPSYWKLIGLVSFGAPTCGLERVPGVYTKVRPYIDWILENVRN